MTKNIIINKFNARIMRLCVILLASFLAGVMLCGCAVTFTTGLTRNDICKISGRALSRGTLGALILTMEDDYTTSFGEDILSSYIEDVPVKTYIRQEAKERLLRLGVCELLAEKKAVTLSSDDESQVRRQAEELYAGMNEWHANYVSSAGITEKDVQEMCRLTALFNKVYSSIVDSQKYTVVEADTKVIEVTYALYDGEELLSEDTIYLSKGSADKEFEEAAFSLKTGEVSAPVVTEKGSYIIECISDYVASETAANKEKIISEMKAKAFNDEYIPFVSEQTIEFNEEASKGL